MPVKVAFMKPGGLGHAAAIGAGECRISELLTIGGTVTTTAAAQDGEMIYLLSSETENLICAHGSTQNAAATAQTNATTAGYGLPAGMPFPIKAKVGDKIHIAAFG